MSSSRIVLLGSTGMLGRYVNLYFTGKGYSVFIPPVFDVRTVTREQLQTLLSLEEHDVVINCIGLIKQRDGVTDDDMYAVNGKFPHLLAEVAEEEGAHLIHVTTDCVFDGSAGNYDEEEPHTAADVYGVSKSLGEPVNATVIRTSIIGSELGRKLSLLEWVKTKREGNCEGFTNHFWNGVTCLELAKKFEEIITEHDFWGGVRHYFSPRSLSKYELVKMISDVYGLRVSIAPVEAPQKIDRTLSTIYVFKLPPDIKKQLEELKTFDEKNGLHDRV